MLYELLAEPLRRRPGGIRQLALSSPALWHRDRRRATEQTDRDDDRHGVLVGAASVNFCVLRPLAV